MFRIETAVVIALLLALVSGCDQERSTGEVAIPSQEQVYTAMYAELFAMLDADQGGGGAVFPRCVGIAEWDLSDAHDPPPAVLGTLPETGPDVLPISRCVVRGHRTGDGEPATHVWVLPLDRGEPGRVVGGFSVHPWGGGLTSCAIEEVGGEVVLEGCKGVMDF